MNEDFGFGGTGQTVETVVDTEEKTDLETGEVGQEGKTNLDNNNTGEEKQVNTNTDDNKGSSSTGGQEESVFKEGDSIKRPTDGGNRIGFYVACCENKQALRDLMIAIENKVNILYK